MSPPNLKRSKKQHNIEDLATQLNHFELEPLNGQRCIEYLTRVVNLGYLYGKDIRKTIQFLVQKLINNTLEVTTFCHRIMTVLDLKKCPQLIDFIRATIDEVRMECYERRVTLRGIKRPPGRAVGVLKPPREQTFPLPISEDYRVYKGPVLDYIKVHTSKITEESAEFQIVFGDDIDGEENV